MPIVSTDIKYRLSGGASNADPTLSLGGVKSSEDVPSGQFDAVSAAEGAAGDVEYRAFYVHNAHATLALENAVAWIQSQSLGASQALALALGSSAVNGTEQSVANENTAPTGVTWVTNATTKANGIALGNIPAGQSRAVWIRRTVTAGAPASNNNYTLRVEGDTAP